MNEPDVNDLNSVPEPPTGAPAHRAPPTGWRPMSGISLTAFVLSILLAIASVFTGLWWLMLLPLTLAVWGMRRANPVAFRGRGFAITALVISVLVGAYAFFATKHLILEIQRITADVGRILAADTLDEPERVKRLNGWVHERAQEKQVAEDIIARFQQLEQEMGPYGGSIEPTSIMSGYIALMIPPGDPSLHEIGDKTEGVPGVSVGKLAFWGKMQFEKGEVYVGLFLYSEGDTSSMDVQSRLKPDETARIFSDIRFYVPPEGKR